MTLYVLILTVIVALLRGGKMAELQKVDLRHVWVFPLAVVMLGAFEISKRLGWIGNDVWLYSQPAVYMVVIAGLLLNAHIRGAMMLALGTFMNLLAMAANGGQMPVSMDALKAAKLSGAQIERIIDVRHSLMTEHTRLAFLGDVIPVSWPWWLRNVGSIGDMVILVAMAYMVWRMFFPVPYKAAGKPRPVL